MLFISQAAFYIPAYRQAVIDHQCKLGFVSVLDEMGDNLDSEIGAKVLRELEFDLKI